LRIVDLEDELDFESIRENEGEAANYGIYYDDTSYDYMQHLREVGEDSDEAHFVDSAPVRVQGKGKGKGKMMKLEDALRETSLDDQDGGSHLGPGSVIDDGFSSFSSTRPKTYQDMQDVPDEIAGFQPDMDPRLREALEALEDDAYVDEQDDEDVFGALTQGGQGAELDLDEFELMQDDEDDGWESDATEKAPDQPFHTQTSATERKAAPSDSTDMSAVEAEAASAEDGDWLRDFAKFKRDKANQPDAKVKGDLSAAPPSDIQAPASTLYTLGGTPLRQKRRKGALTNPSAYSMTSSSLARTDGQRLLDDRFEKIEATYALNEGDKIDDDDDGGMSLASGISKQSKLSTVSTRSFADGPVRSDLEGMMDGFLDGWNQGLPRGGKRNGAKGKRGKNGNEVLGMKMLDEVRESLGPARLRAQKT
jgi:protein LTV1